MKYSTHLSTLGLLLAALTGIFATKVRVTVTQVRALPPRSVLRAPYSPTMPPPHEGVWLAGIGGW